MQSAFFVGHVSVTHAMMIMMEVELANRGTEKGVGHERWRVSTVTNNAGLGLWPSQWRKARQSMAKLNTLNQFNN